MSDLYARARAIVIRRAASGGIPDDEAAPLLAALSDAVSVAHDHDALYDTIEALGIAIYRDGERWTAEVRGYAWTGYTTPVEAARSALLRLMPR